MSPRPVRVLELRSVWGTGGGPDKTILNGARVHDPARVALTVCYIRDARDKVFALDRRAAELGIDYSEVIERHSFDPGIWPQLRTLVRDREIDIVHAHDYKTDAAAWALAKRTPIIPLSTAHGFAMVSLSQRTYYAVEKRLLARFPRVIAVASHIKAELVRTGSHPDRVTVINNAIDPQVFRGNPARRAPIRRALGYSDDDLVIGAVGRLEQEKQFDMLIEVIARLRAKRPTVKLAIVGEGTLRSELEAVIARLDQTSVVQLLGHRTDVVDLYQAFDVFVQSSEREGTPNCVLEAMAMEAPLVATDVGGTSELATNEVHGLLVPRNDPDRLLSALDRAIGDPAGRAARVAAARLRTETDLSFERRIRRIEDIYDELIQQASATARAR